MANWLERHLDQRAIGDRIADGVTAFMGSWAFILIQTALMAGWVAYNTVIAGVWLATGAFDPFPFVFLNLFMSAEAAYSSPFILMSQNRQAEHDRVKAEHDYLTNQQTLALLRRIAHVTGLTQDEVEQILTEVTT